MPVPHANRLVRGLVGFPHRLAPALRAHQRYRQLGHGVAENRDDDARCGIKYPSGAGRARTGETGGGRRRSHRLALIYESQHSQR